MNTGNTIGFPTTFCYQFTVLDRIRETNNVLASLITMYCNFRPNDALGVDRSMNYTLTTAPLEPVTQTSTLRIPTMRKVAIKQESQPQKPRAAIFGLVSIESVKKYPSQKFIFPIDS